MIHEFFHDCLESLEILWRFVQAHPQLEAVAAIVTAFWKKEIKECFTVYLPFVWLFLKENQGIMGVKRTILTGSPDKPLTPPAIPATVPLKAASTDSLNESPKP